VGVCERTTPSGWTLIQASYRSGATGSWVRVDPLLLGATVWGAMA
jgi:hypothetical protein